MANPRAIDPAIPVAVAPTPTVLAAFDTGTTATLTVQVENTDATQTLSCDIQRRAITSAPFVSTGSFLLQDIQPLASACVDIDVAGNSDFRIVGTASGAGLTANICGRDKPRSSR